MPVRPVLTESGFTRAPVHVRDVPHRGNGRSLRGVRSLDTKTALFAMPGAREGPIGTGHDNPVQRLRTGP